MKKFLLFLLWPLMLASCGDDNTVNHPVAMTLYNIVTYEGETDGVTLFTFRQVDDSPLISLTTPQRITSQIERGERLRIAYQSEGGAYESAQIRLLAASKVNNGAVKCHPTSEFEFWCQDPVWVASLWRTGSYINLDCRLMWAQEARQFCIVADRSTLATQRPQLYIVHALPQGAAASYMRSHFASWDIADVWDLPGITGVDIHVNNSNLPQMLFCFDKQAAE